LSFLIFLERIYAVCGASTTGSDGAEKGDEGGNMARAKKRITRKELLKEPDEFLTFSAKTIRFVQENQNRVSYVLIGLVVVILGVLAFRYFSGVKEQKAYALFEEGFVHYVDQASRGQAMAATEMAKTKFGEVIQQYGSTKAARLSLPLYAKMHYSSGAYDKAVEFYRKALKAFAEEPSVLPIIWNDLGYAYEGKKDYQSVIDCLQKVIGFQGDFLKADAYFNLGRMYEALDQTQKALEAFETVANNYANSVYGKLAWDKVDRLKG
jgi:tetratricopeptide (TPR) repeat protein